MLSQRQLQPQLGHPLRQARLKDFRLTDNALCCLKVPPCRNLLSQTRQKLPHHRSTRKRQRILVVIESKP